MTPPALTTHRLLADDAASASFWQARADLNRAAGHHFAALVDESMAAMCARLAAIHRASLARMGATS